MKPFVIVEDEGGPSLFTDRVGDEVVLCAAFKETFVPVGEVPAFAQRLVEALYTAAGLPAPELASQIGADNSGQLPDNPGRGETTQDDDWRRLREVAWAGEGRA